MQCNGKITGRVVRIGAWRNPGNCRKTRIPALQAFIRVHVVPGVSRLVGGHAGKDAPEVYLVSPEKLSIA